MVTLCRLTTLMPAWKPLPQSLTTLKVAAGFRSLPPAGTTRSSSNSRHRNRDRRLSLWLLKARDDMEKLLGCGRAVSAIGGASAVRGPKSEGDSTGAEWAGQLRRQ